MVFTDYEKRRALYYHRKGYKSPTISRLLRAEGLKTSRRGIHKFLTRFHQHGTIHRLPGSARPSKVTSAVKEIVEQQMRNDDETTAYQLHKLLNEKNYELSLRTVLRCRTELGWTFRGSAYCQLIRQVNKTKRLNWANEHKDDSFEDVIFTDETTVQLETHRRFCCRKKGEQPRSKPRPKHPAKVHVWAGISWQGPTSVCIFEGKMNAPLFVEILEKTLVPFVVNTLPNHKFMQDNDPKHTSRLAARFFEENSINWWKTPPESPDLNPIENMWHELKEYLRREIKPKTKQELIDGVSSFWRTVTIAKCRRYIFHIKKVIPKVIELNGEATGY